MKRTQAALLALIPAFALGYSACVGGAASESDDTTAEEESAMIAPDPGLIGTFRNEENRIDSLSLLVLMRDGTYHRGMTVGCPREACAVEDDGDYRLWVRGKERFISLYPYSSRIADEYGYVLDGETLRIAEVGNGDWTSLQKTESASWCAEPVDCDLQNLPVGPCAGAWQCARAICNYSCGPIWPTE
jgi:hypothetical protein